MERGVKFLSPHTSCHSTLCLCFFYRFLKGAFPVFRGRYLGEMVTFGILYLCGAFYLGQGTFASGLFLQDTPTRTFHDSHSAQDMEYNPMRCVPNGDTAAEPMTNWRIRF